jgi:putative ABC transport system permease protein
MSLLQNIFGGLRGLFGKERAERELDEELRGYIEASAAEKIGAGMSREDALRAARLELGGTESVKEGMRAAGWEYFFDTLWQDLRFGVRLLRKSPGFTAVAVLTLSLGIGANTTIFSVINAVLLRPLAMEEPSRVVLLQEQWKGPLANAASVGNFADLRRQTKSLATLCASNSASFNLATPATPERVQGELATADYFATFGVQPIIGRVFTSEEDKPGRGQVVVISEGLWRTHLHADPAIVGQELRIDSMPYTVVGVMPKTFDPLLDKSALWIPEAFTEQKLADYDDTYLSVIGRLNAGVSLEQAQSELNVIAPRLQREHPIDDEGLGLHVTPLATILLGDQRLTLRMMLAAVGFVLLIACANIANLQLARSRTRQKEMALRAALGASPQRIVRQLLMENAVLGLASGLFGVLLAFWGVSWIVANGPAGVPRLDEASIDTRALVFACGIALFSSFLFGLAPALRSGSIRLNEVFKEAAGRSSGSRDLIRSGLVVGEIALALILMTGAVLLIRSALLVSHLDPGFDTSNLVVGRVGLPDVAYHDPAVARQTFERLIATAGALPGVQSAAAVSRAPLAGDNGSNGLIVEGKTLSLADAINSQSQFVSVNYLSTARIPFEAGRDFTEQDTRDKRLVAIINETLARTAWPGENPIGKRFACCEIGPKGRTDPVWHEVVGVVGDVRAWGLDRKVEPEFYLPIAQMPPAAWDWIGRTMDLVVRTRGGVFPANDLRTTVASVAPGVPIYHLSTMRQKISGALEQSHFDTFLLAVFATTALLLSSVGIYGVLSYVVAQRTHTIGIRIALGATQTHVLRDVVAYGVRLTSLGLLIGLACSLVLTRFLSHMIFGVHPNDPLSFAGVIVLMLIVALAACYIPARRATKVDPMVALRHE